MKLRPFIGSILCVSILLSLFSGCNRSSNNIVGYDINVGTNNIDPQFYEDKIAEMLILNLYEGLVVKDSEGNIYPGVAKEWTVSEDGLVYEFKLREDSYWMVDDKGKSEKVSPKDFVFAFKRLFAQGSASPHSTKYLSIKNSANIVAGKEETDNLGVKIIGENILRIELEYQDQFFLEKLTLPPAMPCNEDFFISTRGRYGLEKDLFLGNGPFELSRWEKENRITLSRNENYKGETEVKLETVDFYIARENVSGRFYDSKTDILKISYEEAENLNKKDFTIKSYDNIVWCITFNSESDYWGIPFLRQAIAYSTNREKINIGNNDRFSVTDSIFSDGIELGGEKLKDEILLAKRIGYDLKKAQTQYKLGLDSLHIDRIPKANILIPEGTHEGLLAPLQSDWKDATSLYININKVTSEELALRIRAKKYDIALMPLKSDSQYPQGILNQFISTSRSNYVGYKSNGYDTVVEGISSARTTQQALEKVLQAEQFLLSDAIVIPLYIEKGYYAVSKSAKDIDIYPMDGVIRFHKASISTE